MSPPTCDTYRLFRLGLFFYVIFASPSRSEEFSVERMCEIRCTNGRGGLLCQCSATHFGGKRGEAGGLPSLFPDQEEEKDVEEEEEEEAEFKPTLVDVLTGGSRGLRDFSLSSLRSPSSSLSSRLSSLSSAAAASSNGDPGSRGPAHGGSGSSASGHKANFRPGDDAGEGEMVVEGFFGVEGRQRASARRLVDLLKAAIGGGLTDNAEAARKW